MIGGPDGAAAACGFVGREVVMCGAHAPSPYPRPHTFRQWNRHVLPVSASCCWHCRDSTSSSFRAYGPRQLQGTLISSSQCHQHHASCPLLLLHTTAREVNHEG